MCCRSIWHVSAQILILPLHSKSTGIDKAAVAEAVLVRAPGPMHGGVGSGLVGDTIGDHRVHGGD